MGVLTFVVVLALGLAAFWLLRPILLGTRESAAPEVPSPSPVVRRDPATQPPQEARPASALGAQPATSAPTTSAPTTSPSTPGDSAPTRAPTVPVDPPMPDPDPRPSRRADVDVVFRGPRGMLVRHNGEKMKLDAPYTFPSGTFIYAYQCPGRRWTNAVMQLELRDDPEPLALAPCKVKR
jgi:hypothetical protein